MSSSICPHFTQNAWKKDLCSNCFKSKDEHKPGNTTYMSKYSSAIERTKFAANLMSKSDLEHKKTDYPNKYKSPTKSIMKKSFASLKSKTSKGKTHKVSFPKNISEVIGVGGEWSDNDSDDDDDHDFMNIGNEHDDNAATSTDDEETLELKRITRANTDFNMNNGNLLGDPQDNIKRSFAALKLGAPQVDKEGKKQTLKINVMPFGANDSAKSIATSTTMAIATTTVKAKFETRVHEPSEPTAVVKQSPTVVKSTKKTAPATVVVAAANGMKNPATATSNTTTTKTVTTYIAPSANSSLNASTKQETANDSDGKNSPPIERAMEKSLLDEISETLEKKQTERKNLANEKLDASANNNNKSNAHSTTAVNTASDTTTSAQPSKIKFEISSLSDTLENKPPFLELKKPIARNPPITKDHAKPKINVFHKYADSDSNCSDNENGISAYYDVVETEISYENLPDGKCDAQDKSTVSNTGAVVTTAATTITTTTQKNNKNAAAKQNDATIFSSSQYITDMLLSSKTRAASYNLHEGNFMTSKISADGMIVTKCSSDDALDSTGSSFDGSSDEETSYNMIRSESDSGIGISIGNEYKNCSGAEKERVRVEKKLSVSTNNSDYEDIQVANQAGARTPSAKEATKTTATKTTATTAKAAFILEKSRELHGEPDGSADPDGSLENKEATKVQSTPQAQQPPQQQLPALPKSPPPTKLIDARPSFLHGLQKQQPPILLKKPDLPAKPLVVSPTGTPLKTFASKRTPTNAEQQVINQLHLVMSKSNENLNLSALTPDAAKDDAKLKKGRAPNPPPELKSSAPPTPEHDYNYKEALEFEQSRGGSKNVTPLKEALSKKLIEQQCASPNTQKQATVSKTNNEQGSSNASAHIRAEADKTHATINCQTANEQKTATNAITTPVATSAVNSTANMYARKSTPTTPTTTTTHATQSNHAVNNNKNSSSPVVREKDKRERATVNPKFRSLNTFVTQRSNALKNMQLQSATSSLSLKQSLTPEPLPKKTHKQLSLSEECLADASHTNTTVNLPTLPPSAMSDKKLSPQLPTTPTQKTKTKFSIKKFLRMGANKTSDNLHQKKDGIYSEICTGEEAGITGKPRLVIIHPIDINPTAVEVIKDITKTNDAVAAQTVTVVTAKPPAPPVRNIDTLRSHELNKPARPPPPKSAELRRKQAINGLTALSVTDSPNGRKISGLAACEAGGSMKCKSDNVYANLGEIRSSIAPRKPERTASMREREAQLELARKRHAGARNENVDNISICSSNGDNVSFDQNSTYNNTHTSTNPNGATANNTNNNNNKRNIYTNNSNTMSPQLSSGDRAATPTMSVSGDGKPPTGSRTSTFERRKSDPKISIANKLEIFENRTNSTNGAVSPIQKYNEGRPTSLKDSVRKINNTIDNYLKDKREYENMYEMVKSPSSPPLPPTRSVDLIAAQRLLPPRRNNNNNSNLYSDTMSVASYTRSEYGPGRNFGLNNSLANIPRIISASYCGSEVGEFDIYAPYSYYGSETGGDVATDINDSVWGIPSAIKQRAKATNRLRMRKGRSVVHKNIEDNYTAVVVANHEALAQVLDQLQQTPIIPPALRPLANAINLRFEDFTILEGAQAFVVGKKAFHAALWTTAPVTLALSADSNQLSGVGGELSQLSGGVCGVLNPITEFCDLVPSYHLPLMPSTAITLLQATISVLPRLQLDTLQTIGAILKGKSQVLDKSNYNFRGSIPNLAAVGFKDSVGVNALRNVVSVQNLSTLNEETSLEKCGSATLESTGGDNNNTTTTTVTGMPAFDDVMTREVAFIMLQLVNGMKNLQAKAIEEMPLSLSNVVLSKDVENKDAQARLCVLQGNNNDEDEPMGTLCKCAHIALTDLLPHTKITPIIADILLQERAESLSKSKSVLEFVLWGPSDVVLSGSIKERELALQRWLDLERATVLHGLVRTRVELTVYDECHLMFLVRSTAKMMNDAAKIVCNYQKPLAEQIQHKQQNE